ncbi:hypothetical protein F5I97DRAFT_1925674 [Phlebopus sp. FC_14]|nr:hypothetical protein F5I97DRAFT_1925674 [Phlebopus sp. FC_14]
MHKALHITEILHAVCGFAAQDSLAKLARTCRAFEEPALDALWANLETLEPLVHCLPSNIWGTLGGKLILHRPLHTEHWRLLRKYSNRICRIEKGTPYGTGLRYLIALASHANDARVSLFPNLRVLLSCRLTSDRIPLFCWLIGPSLIQLQLSIEGVSPRILAFLASVARLCPRMETILLNPVKSVDTDLSATSISQSICQWNHLVHASFGALDVSAYEHVSQLRSLTYLKLSISRASLTHLCKATLQPTAFTNVCDLVLDAESLLVAAAWLDCLSRDHAVSLCLSQLTVNIRECERTTRSLHSLCLAICSHLLSHDTLHSIELDDLRCQYGVFLVVMVDIQPLLIFRNVKRVILHELAAVTLGDEELEELAQAWPCIEVLHLNRYVADPEATGLSTVLPRFSGLCTLARLCPHLRELSIVADLRRPRTGSVDPRWSMCFDFTGSDIAGVTNDWVSHHQMSTLILGNSLLDDPKFAAFMLGDIFPCLSRVELEDWDFLPLYEVSKNDEGRMLESWEKLNEYMEDFAIVRVQERRRAMSLIWDS